MDVFVLLYLLWLLVDAMISIRKRGANSWYIRPDLDEKGISDLMDVRTFSRKVVFAIVFGQDLSGICDVCLNTDAKAELVDTAKTYVTAVDEMQATSLTTIKPKKGVYKKKKKMSKQKDLHSFNTAKKVLVTESGRRDKQ